MKKGGKYWSIRGDGIIVLSTMEVLEAFQEPVLGHDESYRKIKCRYGVRMGCLAASNKRDEPKYRPPE
jgi:hypothetical protein